MEIGNAKIKQWLEATALQCSQLGESGTSDGWGPSFFLVKKNMGLYGHAPCQNTWLHVIGGALPGEPQLKPDWVNASAEEGTVRTTTAARNFWSFCMLRGFEQTPPPDVDCDLGYTAVRVHDNKFWIQAGVSFPDFYFLGIPAVRQPLVNLLDWWFRGCFCSCGR